MKFDKIVHQSTRLQILSYLYKVKQDSFNALKDELELTEGNLSSHLQKLEDAGYVETKKEFVERKPKTTYEITKEGEEALEDHVNKLEKVVKGL